RTAPDRHTLTWVQQSSGARADFNGGAASTRAAQLGFRRRRRGHVVASGWHRAHLVARTSVRRTRTCRRAPTRAPSRATSPAALRYAREVLELRLRARPRSLRRGGVG